MIEVFRVINDMVAAKVIETYALGGAIGAYFYVEPFYTTDIDIFFPITVQSSSIISLGPLYEHLAGQGFHPNGEAVEIAGWQVQFLAAPDALVEEAIHNASVRDVGGVPVRVMAAPYLVAIMLQTGRQKDFVRIQMFFDQEVLSETGFLQELVRKFNLEQQWEKWQKFKEIK